LTVNFGECANILLGERENTHLSLRCGRKKGGEGIVRLMRDRRARSAPEEKEEGTRETVLTMFEGKEGEVLAFEGRRGKDVFLSWEGGEGSVGQKMREKRGPGLRISKQKENRRIPCGQTYEGMGRRMNFAGEKRSIIQSPSL